MSSVDAWPRPPREARLKEGQLIRERKVYDRPMTTRPVRAGGAEPKVIVAETCSFVIWRTWSAKGGDLGEQCLPLAEFEAKFERGETVQYIEEESNG